MSLALTAKILPLACVSSLIGVFAYLPSRTQVRSEQISPAPSPALAGIETQAPQPPDLSGLPELELTDLIKRPVGPLGLELSDHVKELEGKHVRVTGFMVHTDWADQTSFMLAGYPSNVSEREFGPCDDLPPIQLFVKLPGGVKSGFQRGVLVLAGTLRTGSAEETNDRRSFLRLELDPDLKNWHVTPKIVSAWSEEIRSQYQFLCAQQTRITCASCSLPADPQAPAFVSPTSTINTRKNKL